MTTREERTMEASELDVLGPVDYLAAELTALVDRGLVRVLDLVLLRKEADESVEAAELADLDESDVGALRALEADLAMLLAEEDVAEIGKALEPGSYAAVLVYENSWAGPFASSIRRAGLRGGCGRGPRSSGCAGSGARSRLRRHRRTARLRPVRGSLL